MQAFAFAYDEGSGAMGQVRLVSDAWDYVAVVEIREGTFEDPEQNQVVYRGSVSRGQSFLSQDGVQQCYKRSDDPSDPSSPLGGWSCNSNTIGGVDDWSLS
jgi:hypothetical protein